MYDIDEELMYSKSKLLDEMKKNTGLCAECGKTFEQGFRVDSKTGEKKFNKYKYCSKCRSQIAKKMKKTKQQMLR